MAFAALAFPGSHLHAVEPPSSRFELSADQLAAIPEPGTIASIAGGVAILVGWRRWRRVGSHR